MINVRTGLDLFREENRKLGKGESKRTWDEMNDSDKEDYEKKAARESIEHVWSSVIKKQSAYGLFVLAKNKEISGKTFTERNAIVSSSWKSASDEEKKKYQDMADQENARLGKDKAKKEKKETKKPKKDEKEEKEEKKEKKTEKKVTKKPVEKKATKAEEKKKEPTKKADKKETGKTKDDSEAPKKKKPSLKKKAKVDSDDE